MELAITGLPLSGKTTLFNALTGGTVATGAYSKETHRGVVKVPDERLVALGEMFRPKKLTPVDVQYVDVAGLVKGGARDESTALLNALHPADALIVVIRAFASAVVAEPAGGIDPERDAADFELELMMSDLDTAERRIDRLSREVQAGRSEGKPELDALSRWAEALSRGTPLRELEFTADEEKRLRGFQFLSVKPMILIANISEDDLPRADELAAGWAHLAARPHMHLVALCAELEMEISQLEPEDQGEFLAELGIEQPALTRFIQESYSLLHLITFFTCGGKDEARAWAIKKGTLAPQAAGVIHTDFERGFIRAEVISFEDLAACGSFSAAREKGLLRLEGKSYEVREGDVLTIRFSV